jgi:hypothetical protein
MPQFGEEFVVIGMGIAIFPDQHSLNKSSEEIGF